MKILWVKPGKLLPLDSGGKLRTYNILRHLSFAHDVTFVSYYRGPRDHRYEREIADQIRGSVSLLVKSQVKRGPMRYVDYAISLGKSAPYAVSQFAEPEVATMVGRWMTELRFDAAICDFLASSLNFPRNLPIPTVLFQHNVETVLWSRRAQLGSSTLERWSSRLEAAKMSAFEPRQVRRFHHVFAVSSDDRRAMTRMVDPSRITVIPTGVDLSTYEYDHNARVKDPLVVFTGSMDWAPNIDAVEYFCREIWPEVLKEVPEARFRIVGRNPHHRVRSLADASVVVTGSVPSVVDHLKESAVVVVPLRAGGGTRIKIYEGMAMGKATVSTTIGAEGLDVTAGRDILLADDPKTFAQHVITLLADEGARSRVGTAAAETARKHDWSIVADLFAKALLSVIGNVSRGDLASQAIPSRA